MRKATVCILYLIFLPVSFLTTVLHAENPDINGIIYVKQGGTGSGNSWGNATGDLQAAINAVGVTQVWVAAGTYKPNTSGNSFSMKNGIAILGGFSGDGTGNLQNRNWVTNETILQGNGDRVLSNTGLSATAILDGFIITGGSTVFGAGVGMLNDASSPTLGNLKITGNSTTNSNGGGMYNANFSSPVLTNVQITDNKATAGGGMYNTNFSSPTLTNVQITNNTASGTDGGGIFNSIGASLTLTNVQVTGNTAYRYGGGIYNDRYAPTLTNVQISGNTADAGGGIYNNFMLTLTNVEVTGNNATGIEKKGGGIYNAAAVSTPNSLLTNVTLANNGIMGIYANSGYLSLNNSIIWDIINWDVNGNDYTTNHCLVKGSNSTANGNVDATGLTDAAIFTNPSAGDYTLTIGSPAINKGSNGLFPDLTANIKDLAGSPRLFASTIDMGAYEYQGIDALPVTFGSLSAVIKNGQLRVNWTTETETSNDHFLIQGSADGIHFTTIQTVQSKAASGNSSAALEYSTAIPLAGLSLGIGFLALGMMAGSRHKYALVIMAILLGILAFSCSKKDIFKSIEEGKLFVRIVQVDKDGKERVSKVVQAVRE
ncbi:choice-of-anchor Q domain-containing protein [Niabella drilacis]|uniref:Right handed beta helix domain-containing protein n=1 Tax=Niabella drilacis (strain DSM 25811 / CCM 8410 / CCUG 62505 / LMG 26954 / E90) TaxID=1285928 RepID=A0A1G6YV62_NIADE|nr:choice-of-anchor Q domain-containing protein [Niabella drilacis]SDD94289.1 hypothetical protein SAMN04487894_116109 [Niabella drilacis]